VISRWVVVLTTVLATASGCSGDDPSGLGSDDEHAGPVVTGAVPTALPCGSTFELRVFGSGFDERSRVVLTLNGSPTPKVRTNGTRFVSTRELDAIITTAADAPGGPYDIVVEGTNGKQGVGTELVDAKAHVFEITPDPAEWGQLVTISGINFGTHREQVVVTFDLVEASVQSVSNTSIIAVVPATPSFGMAPVRVSIAGIQARRWGLYGPRHQLQSRELRVHGPSHHGPMDGWPHGWLCGCDGWRREWSGVVGLRAGGTGRLGGDAVVKCRKEHLR
jgi:hypothetical protein